jgi:hypothetical protein
MVEAMQRTGSGFSSSNLDVSSTLSGRFSINVIATPPSVNTVLEIAGPWLFDAALHKRDGYESGRARAIQTIGDIFCSPCRSGRGVDIMPSYSTRYIMAIEKAMEDEDPEAIAAILASSKLVLGCNFKGAQVRCSEGASPCCEQSNEGRCCAQSNEGAPFLARASPCCEQGKGLPGLPFPCGEALGLSSLARASKSERTEDAPPPQRLPTPSPLRAAARDTPQQGRHYDP